MAGCVAFFFFFRVDFDTNTFECVGFEKVLASKSTAIPVAWYRVPMVLKNLQMAPQEGPFCCVVWRRGCRCHAGIGLLDLSNKAHLNPVGTEVLIFVM